MGRQKLLSAKNGVKFESHAEIDGKDSFRSDPN